MMIEQSATKTNIQSETTHLQNTDQMQTFEEMPNQANIIRQSDTTPNYCEFHIKYGEMVRYCMTWCEWPFKKEQRTQEPSRYRTITKSNNPYNQYFNKYLNYNSQYAKRYDPGDKDQSNYNKQLEGEQNQWKKNQSMQYNSFPSSLVESNCFGSCTTDGNSVEPSSVVTGLMTSVESNNKSADPDLNSTGIMRLLQNSINILQQPLHLRQ